MQSIELAHIQGDLLVIDYGAHGGIRGNTFPYFSQAFWTAPPSPPPLPPICFEVAACYKWETDRTGYGMGYYQFECYLIFFLISNLFTSPVKYIMKKIFNCPLKTIILTGNIIFNKLKKYLENVQIRISSKRFPSPGLGEFSREVNSKTYVITLTVLS